ncbi:MAG TPA: M28 family peptidase [Longilinea sp.]|nr:M28 family peptidase [Longilinea sp.]
MDKKPAGWIRSLVWVIVPLTALAVIFFGKFVSSPIAQFNGERAYQDILYQLELGPRTPESPGHAEIIEWITTNLQEYGWEVQIQQDTVMGHPIENIVAHRGSGSPIILIGAHYDTRFIADQDPDPQNTTTPVPGANDGASGVAVLLELARTLPNDLDREIWLVFFDAEDQGRIDDWNWILGSTSYVENMTTNPDAVVIIDMIGDSDLNIPMERNSTPALTDSIWQTAEELGYAQYFIQEPGYSMLDDHTPFLNAGISAVDIIDFDYPYWHTTQDTAANVSAHSLQVVGDTLLQWSQQWQP